MSPGRTETPFFPPSARGISLAAAILTTMVGTIALIGWIFWK